MNKEIEHIRVIATLVTKKGKKLELEKDDFPVKIENFMTNEVRTYKIFRTKENKMVMNGEK